jgi:electron transfer flavoprotein alpha subunit
VTDAIALRLEGGEVLVDRYALGGNTVATERIRTSKKVFSVMPGTFEAGPGGSEVGQPVRITVQRRTPAVRVLQTRAKGAEVANLEAAERLVGVGKGLARKEDLGLVYELADALRAEVGCTRSLAADYQWLSEERLIGLSGKKCKPRLYVALGISGQIQHTVGIAGAKTIVAVNKDKEAPIFRIADYGIVGDLYQVVPRLIARVRQGSG